MLARVTLPNGVVVYQSRMLAAVGVAHAFSTRIGGVSPAPFDSLNLGNPQGAVQDSGDNLQRNFAILLSALGLSNVPMATVQQVHGCEVALLRAEGEGEYSETAQAEIRDRFQGQTRADAIVSDVTSAMLAIRIADCAPILLASDDGRIVAAIHAGWRGVVSGVVARSVAEINTLGITSDRIVAAIGPTIGVKHFEVGAEVAGEFHTAGLSAAIDTIGYAKPHINLVAAIKLQLQQCGVTHVDGGSLCTYASATDFYSHRRDHGTTGRMVAIIQPANA
ncbi:MAG: peptidoglycan editing factor PgeF [Phycisphaerae bacterium]